MTVQTFKARSIQEALQMVRESLGPEATILETRTVFAGLLPWFRRPSHVIVTASCEVKIPSRLPPTTSKLNISSPAEAVDRLSVFARPPSKVDSRPIDVGAPAVVAASYVEQLYQLEQQTHPSDHSSGETPSTRITPRCDT
ncbi:MAG TPA: hypothetical protein EYM79_03110, partial [Planctomycetes bacterium]|nr:hypothetical protein [Planctomycetota bacterium]